MNRLILPHLVAIASTVAFPQVLCAAESQSCEHSFSVGVLTGYSTDEWAHGDRFTLNGLNGRYTVSPVSNANSTFRPEAGVYFGFIRGDADGDNGAHSCDLSDVFACAAFGIEHLANQNFSTHLSVFAGIDILRADAGGDEKNDLGFVFGVDFAAHIALAPNHAVTIGICASSSSAKPNVATTDDSGEISGFGRQTFLLFHVGYKITL